jgi:thymidylate kinase
VAGLARAVRPPDLTLLLDVPVSVAAERRRAAGRTAERYDEDGFQARVAANYRRLAASAMTTAVAGARPIVVVDGTRSKDDVTDAIAREVERLMAAPAC